MAAYEGAKASRGPSPLGVAITGQQGSGKTHMLGVVRSEVQRRGGYFFLVSLLQGSNFWQNVVHALRAGLHCPGLGGEKQLAVALTRLANRLDLSDEARRQVVGEAPLTRMALRRARRYPASGTGGHPPRSEDRAPDRRRVVPTALADRSEPARD
jgi:hypothetical protein